MRELHEEFWSRAGAGPTSSPAPVPTDAAAASPWDTELFLVRGVDRADVLRRARALEHVLEANASVDLKDLAYTLNTGPDGAGGSCLALVAGSVEHLRARLATAVERLADPKRTQIKDNAGVYYIDRPLGAEGSLALLFPGEGGQYLNMLADLCPHFPEVRAAFSNAERLAWDQSTAAGERFGRLYRLPDTASAEERSRAETDLNQLDTIASGVLLADWAMFALLSELGLQPAAMAGHSLGEIAALQACGAIGDTEGQLARVGSLLAELTSLEATGEIVPSMVVAVGAGREAVGEVVREAGGSVYFAMDNCPHQTVVVGPRDVMEGVYAELRARRFICERLPFDVPYHTPMFEPHLGPVRALYEGLAFRTPPGPVIYSCNTAKPFPAEPEAIREGAIWNFAQSVEFTALIRNMHADGVRVFVECGPRGNLTSFVEDSLRNERFAAIPSNLPTRSGVTQLNHLAGQLSAHQVPLRLEHLYLRRSPQRIASGDVLEEHRAADVATPATTEDVVYEAVASEAVAFDDVSAPDLLELADYAAPAMPGRGDVVAQHLALMDRFLDDQVDMMSAYLSRPRRPGRTPAASVPRWPIQVIAEGGGVPELAAATPPEPDLPSFASLPLLATATLETYEAGRQITVRRPLDLGEDLFALHHAVGGHAVSKVDPDQHGLSVMPMTFSLETMAELATCLCPGRKAIAVENVRLHQWLAFDADNPASIEATATVSSDAPSHPGASAQVAVEIYLLGRSGLNRSGRSLAAQGTVLVADAYPEPPAAGDFPLVNERPCPIPVDVLYRNLFHGPMFRGVQHCERSGDDGLEGTVEVQPREGLFRSGAEPRFLMDPVTLDIGMHPISAWHLEFEDWSGRILLPIELKSVELFGGQLAPGTRLVSRCSVDGESYRHFTHSVDLVGQDGRLWSRMRKVTLWRFYVPFGEVNFFGPKDEYFISKEWEFPQPAGTGAAATGIRLDMPSDQKQAAMRLLTAKVVLSPTEWRQFGALTGGAAVETQWLFERLAAKDAVRLDWHAGGGERLYPADIVTEATAGGGLSAHPRDPEATAPFPTVSVAFSEDVVFGLAASRPHVGLALAPIAEDADHALDEAEEDLLADVEDDHRAEWRARLASAKQAVRKALGRDGGDPAGAVAAHRVWPETGAVAVALGPILADLYPQWRHEPLAAHTTREGDLAVAVSFCEGTSP